MRVKLAPEHMTVPEAARRLGMSYRGVLAMVRRGDLRGGRRGHHRVWFVSRDSVAAALASRVDRALEALAAPEPTPT